MRAVVADDSEERAAVILPLIDGLKSQEQLREVLMPRLPPKIGHPIQVDTRWRCWRTMRTRRPRSPSKRCRSW
jgi:hypothetical protein